MSRIRNFLILAFAILFVSSTFGGSVETDSVLSKAFRKDIGGWVAADASYSIALPDGKILWLFGDTFFGGTNPDGSIKTGAKFIRNSAVLQNGDSLLTLFSGTLANPQTFILTDHPDSTWYWPENGLVEHDSLYIFLSKFKTAPGPAGFNFVSDGNDIACFTYPGLKLSRILTLPFYQLNGVYYGDKLLEDSTYTYIYGRKAEGGISYPHIARAKHGELTGRWEFWDGWSWLINLSTSRKINNFQVSEQYSVSKHDGKYILLTQDIWFSTDIWTFTSTSPTGPWKNKTKIYSTPKLAASSFTYNAWLHPEFDKDGTFLLSYNNNADFAEVLKNAELYRPCFLRVPYAMLDTAFVTSSPEQMKDGVDAFRLKVYPNPSTDRTCIEFSLNRDEQIDLVLLDYAGREVRKMISAKFAQGYHSLELDVSCLEDGYYFFRLMNTNGSVTHRFVKAG
jgi:hypothetical protein